MGLLSRRGWAEGVCERSSKVGCGIFLCGLIFGVKTEKEPLVGLSKVVPGRDLSLIVGPSDVCVFTKMSLELNFHNSKTPKNCFQFC